MKNLKNIFLVLTISLFSINSFAQENDKKLSISLQTDLLAYTTPNGWSAWGVAKYSQNKLALALSTIPIEALTWKVYKKTCNLYECNYRGISTLPQN